MAVTNIISVLQERFNSQTWAGKPSALWLVAVWPTYGGSFTALPHATFRHVGTSHDPQFARNVVQHWKFEFRVFAETAQAVEAMYAGMMWDGADPEANTGYGFWRPNGVTVPAAYTFKHLVPTDDFVIEVQPDRPGPSGAAIHTCTWGMDLMVHRTTF